MKTLCSRRHAITLIFVVFLFFLMLRNPVAGQPGHEAEIETIHNVLSQINASHLSTRPFISADGQFIAFQSVASNIINNDSNNTLDVFVYDRTNRYIKRVSVGTDRQEGNKESYSSSISADGNLVVFASGASNLLPDNEDTNGVTDIFVHDLKGGTTKRVSVNSKGQQADNSSGWAAISGDGKYVVFTSLASNLDLEIDDTNGFMDVFLYSIDAEETIRISVSEDKQQANMDSGALVDISSDGRFIVYQSRATNLVPYDNFGGIFLYDKDKDLDRTTLITVGYDGQKANSLSENPTISDDGKVIAFESTANNLVLNDDNGYPDIFVYDTDNQKISLVSVSTEKTQSNSQSRNPSISSDGRYITFWSQASNLVNNDTNGKYDIFIHDRLGYPNPTTDRISIATNGQEANNISHNSSISADGRYIAFDSYASNLVINDTNGHEDIFLRDRQTETTTRVSVPNSPCKQSEWFGEYYNNRDLLNGPTLTRCDTEINFNWVLSSPATSIPEDNFSVRWHKYIDIDHDGWYKFRVFTDDGLRLYINNELIINNWSDQSFIERNELIFLSMGHHEVVMEYADWSNEAMVHLTWYECPNGDGDCYLSPEPDYQTRYIDQPMPATCKTVENKTIATWGCLLTSITISLRNFGIITNPAELNEWLSMPDPKSGKTPRGYWSTCDATLIWDEILIYADEIHHVKLGWHITSNAIDVIRNKGVPVIMHVSKGDKNHFVLAVDVIKENGELSLGIIDPHHSWACIAVPGTPNLPPNSILNCAVGPLRHATTVNEEAAYFGNSSPLKYLDYQSKPRKASLQLHIKGAEVMLVDGYNSRTGYDPATGNVLTEIPNSFYYDSSIVPLGQEPNGLIERTLYIPQVPDPNFSLKVFQPIKNSIQADSTEATEAQIYIIGYDEEYNAVEAKFEPGDHIDFTIIYQPGEDIYVIEEEPYPSPSITGLNPPSVLPGSDSITLWVYGKDLFPGATVFWNGKILDTDYDSDYRLRAIVPAEELLEPGTAEITVDNPLPNPGPSVPALFHISHIQPANGSNAVIRRPLLQWIIVPNASSYQVQIATVSNFSTLLTTRTSPTNSVALSSDLPLNKTIYWRVRAKVNGTYQPWSTRYSFRSANPPSNPTLRSPANNALTTNYVPKLVWSQSSLPSGTTFEEYQLQVARDKGFTDLAFERLMTNRTAPSYTVLAGELLPNTTYYWRVRASNTLGHISNWSKPFTLRSAMLHTNLTAPAEASTAVMPRPRFEWSIIQGADNYTIQISAYSNFSELLISANPTGTTYIPTKNLPLNRKIYWRVRGNGINGPSLWAKGWFTSANPPSTPALVSPANSALNTDYMPTLSWRASALPSGTTFLHYRLQVAKDKAFTQELQEKWIDSRTTPFYQYLEGEMLDPDTRYYWRVQAWNTNEHYSTWSAVRYFRTAMVKPTLLTPAEGVTVTTRRPSFEWTPDAGATSYTIQLSVYSNFSTLIRSATPTEPTWTSTVSLPQNKTIYWRVRANGANGPSLWTVGTFKSANPPSTPTLVSPAIGAVSKTLTPKLDWSNSTLPAGTIFKQYELQVATNTAFSGAAVYLVDDRMMSDYTLPALIAKTRYYWRVRAVNMDEHESNWSSRWYFTTP